MFIRIKAIKGQKYGYLVNNSWTRLGTRQKVAKYLGKVHYPEKTRNKTLLEFTGAKDADEFFSSKSFSEIIEALILLELHNHGLEDKFYLKEGEIKALNGKNTVIAANSGFLCTETIKQLMQYNAEKDEGYALANLITYAGLNIEKEHFISLFGKAKAQKAEQQAAPANFYY